MSQHHRRSKHTTRAPKVKAQITALLPLKCTDCPHPVLPEHRWQIGHLTPASQGGQTTIANCGPSHTFCPWCKRACNQRAGGKLGAATTNQRRQQTEQATKGLRRW